MQPWARAFDLNQVPESLAVNPKPLPGLFTLYGIEQSSKHNAQIPPPSLLIFNLQSTTVLRENQKKPWLQLTRILVVPPTINGIEKMPPSPPGPLRTSKMPPSYLAGCETLLCLLLQQRAYLVGDDVQARGRDGCNARLQDPPVQYTVRTIGRDGMWLWFGGEGDEWLTYAGIFWFRSTVVQIHHGPRAKSVDSASATLHGKCISP